SPPVGYHHFHRQLCFIRDGCQMIYDGKCTGLGPVIDTTYTGKKIEPGLLMITQQRCYLTDERGFNNKGRLKSAGLFSNDHFTSEMCCQNAFYGFRIHVSVSSAFTAPAC